MAPPTRGKSARTGQKRALNAFAIAQSAESHAAPARSFAPKRRSNHPDDADDAVDEGSVDGGSDSDGNQWKLGEVDSDESDIDSDEAMGESDEERFEDFAFRGTTGDGGKAKRRGEKKAAKGLNLNEEESEEEDSGSEEDGEGFIDLSEMLDRGTPDGSEDEEVEVKVNKKKRTAPVSDDEEADFGQGSSEESESGDEGDSEDSEDESMDDADEAEDDLKLEALESLISALPNSGDRPSKRPRMNDANEGKAPGEYNLALGSESKKLTILDLMSTVADPALKKSLKLLAGDEKPSATKKGVPGKLSAPLAKRMQDRIDRTAAYGETKETLKRWVDTVKHNREADHLHFPLANATNAPVKGSRKMIPITAGNAKPLNDFEAAISGILKDSNMTTEKQIAEFETLATQKMSIQDVERRTAELRMARELMYREELKAKRIKKIKSKSYHRIKKKERVREQEAIDAALKEGNDGETDSEEEMERERKRAVERMSLKHKQSKWSKGVKDSGRTAWDEDARHGAIEMAQRSEDLRRKIQGKQIGSDGAESSDESSDEDEFDEENNGDREKILAELEKLDAADAAAKGPGSKLMGMKFMQNAEASKRKENEAMINSLKDTWEDDERDSGTESDDVNTNGGRMSFKPGKPEAEAAPKKKNERGEFEAPPASDDEDEDKASDDEVEFTNKASSSSANANKKIPFTAPGASKPTNTRYQPFTNDLVSEQEPVNPWLASESNKNLVKTKAKALVTGKQDSKGAKNAHKHSKARKAALDEAETAADPETSRVTIDTNLTLKMARTKYSDDEASDSDDEAAVQLIPTKGKSSTSQRELVKMAFAGDNVVREFKKGKKGIADEDGDQVVDNTLPGWGSWAGTGLSKQQKSANRRKGKNLSVIKGISKDKRKDRKLEKVIISEKRDKKVCLPRVRMFSGRVLITVLIGCEIPNRNTAASVRDQGAVRAESADADWSRVDYQVDVPGCDHAPGYCQDGSCGGAYCCALQVGTAWGGVCIYYYYAFVARLLKSLVCLYYTRDIRPSAGDMIEVRWSWAGSKTLPINMVIVRAIAP